MTVTKRRYPILDPACLPWRWVSKSPFTIWQCGYTYICSTADGVKRTAARALVEFQGRRVELAVTFRGETRVMEPWLVWAVALLVDSGDLVE